MTLKVERDFLNIDTCDDIISKFLACKRLHMDLPAVRFYGNGRVEIAAELLGIGEVVERVRTVISDAWRTSEIVHDHSFVMAMSTGDKMLLRVGGATLEDWPRNLPCQTHTAMIYLNNGNVGFNGGELLLLADGLRIEPRAGLLVAMSAGIRHPHGVNPITRGICYVLTMGFRRPPSRLGDATGQVDLYEEMPPR